jgi:hypothetical protein
MSVPRSQDAMMLAAGGLGAGAFYSNGALYYRGMPGVQVRMGPGGPSSGNIQPIVPDTMPIVRITLATRVLDTIGFIKIPKTNTSVTRSDDGKMSVNIEANPLPTVDEWAVTSTGHVALIRGKDYHVDIVAPNGTRTVAPKIPFDWKRLTDDEKVRLIDSVKAIRERQAAANPGQGNQLQQAFGAFLGGGGGGGGGPQMVVRMEARGGPGGPPGNMQVMAPSINMTYVSPSELPDYQPPFFATSTRADGDGNVWIRTINTKPTLGGAIYDVVNTKGELIDRVQIPEGRNIYGFAPGGTVILGHTDGGVLRLERANVK